MKTELFPDDDLAVGPVPAPDRRSAAPARTFADRPGHELRRLALGLDQSRPLAKAGSCRDGLDRSRCGSKCQLAL